MASNCCKPVAVRLLFEYVRHRFPARRLYSIASWTCGLSAMVTLDRQCRKTSRSLSVANLNSTGSLPRGVLTLNFIGEVEVLDHPRNVIDRPLQDSSYLGG